MQSKVPVANRVVICGCIGQEYDVVAISDIELTDYLTLTGTIILDNVFNGINTETQYTGNEITSAMAKTMSKQIQYKTPAQIDEYLEPVARAPSDA